MWAQLISFNVKPGYEDALPGFLDRLRAAEQPDSGLVRQTLMHDQSDPRRAYMFVLFESEEKARARENDPHRSEQLDELRALMAEAFDGPPAFTDLVVIAESTT